jgi:hypothetical protein
MAFDDLDEAIEEQDRDDDTNVNDTTEESAANDADATQAATGTGDIQEDSKDDTPLTEPAFEFSEATQSAFYARDNAWDAINDMFDIDLERELLDRGIREVTKSEKQDALLRFAAEQPEAIADLIESERRGE